MWSEQVFCNNLTPVLGNPSSSIDISSYRDYVTVDVHGAGQKFGAVAETSAGPALSGAPNGACAQVLVQVEPANGTQDASQPLANSAAVHVGSADMEME